MIRRNVPWLLLGLSVVFNVFFLAGYLKARKLSEQAQSADGIQTLVRNELDLTKEQAAAFRELHREMAEDASVYHNAIALAEQELVSAMNGDTPDFEQVFGIISREADTHRQWRMAAVERMQRFAERLTPEQRERLRGLMRGGRRGRMPEHVMRRFDTNENGKLDEEERAAAKKHFEERREEMRRQRMERFDADRDGQLDDDERRAMREWDRQRRLVRMFDEDDDGQLDADEQARADAFVRQREQERLERFDANDDGELDEDEARLMHEWEKQQRGSRRHRRGNGSRSHGDRDGGRP